MDHKQLNYPHKIECYQLNEDERPAEYPVVIKIVNTPKESEAVDEALNKEYPGHWIMHRLID